MTTALTAKTSENRFGSPRSPTFEAFQRRDTTSERLDVFNKHLNPKAAAPVRKKNWLTQDPVIQTAI